MGVLFDKLFKSCPNYMMENMPRKLAGEQTIRISMMLRQEYRKNPEGRQIDSRHAGLKLSQSQEGSPVKTFDVVKKMQAPRNVEDTFFAAEAFSSVHLGTSRGDSGEPVFGRLRRHRNLLLSQAPITNVDGMSD